MAFFGARDEESVAVIDVGNASVGISLVRLDRNGPPEVLFSSRVQMKVRDVRTNDSLLSELSRELQPAFERLRTAAALDTDKKSGRLSPRKISQLLFLLSSPWIHISSIRTLRFSRSAPFLVTGDVLERMLADEMRLSQREKESEGFSVIERTVVGLRLNGYPVSALPLTPVTAAEVTFFTSSAAEDLQGKLIEASETAFPGVARSFHSAALASYHGLASLYPSLFSYVLLNVTGEITEILHVEDGAPSAFGTFPMGRNFLLRTLEANSIPVHEALAAIELAKEESSHWSGTLAETLRHAAAEWSSGLREALSALVPSGAFPSTILVVSDERVDSWFADVIRHEAFLAVSRGSAPAVKTLAPAEFGRAILMGQGKPDPLVFLTALFADARFDQRKTIDLLSTKIPLGIPSRATLRH